MITACMQGLFFINFRMIVQTIFQRLYHQVGDLLFSSDAAAALPVNSFDYVNKNKSFPPVQRKQQQKYTENKGKGLQWNDFFGLEEVPHCQKTDQLVFRLCCCFSKINRTTFLRFEALHRKKVL